MTKRVITRPLPRKSPHEKYPIIRQELQRLRLHKAHAAVSEMHESIARAQRVSQAEIEHANMKAGSILHPAGAQELLRLGKFLQRYKKP